VIHCSGSAIVERLTEWLPQLAAGMLEPPAVLGQIAFTSNRDGYSDIYVMNADGGTSSSSPMILRWI